MSDDPAQDFAPPPTEQQPQQGGAPAQPWQQQPQTPVPPPYPPPDYWHGYQAGYPGGTQYPGGYGPGYPAPMPRATSVWAIASLVLSIGGWTVLPLLGAVGGVVTGHIALHEIAVSEGRTEGRGLAIAGLAIGYTALALALCAAAAAIGVVLLAYRAQ